MDLCRKNFITPQGAKSLPSYKYSGSDLSLLYKHFYGKIAQYLVDNVIPATWAPNAITLAGFACTLIPHLIILFYCPHDLQGEVPSWMCLLAAVGQLAYVILDNCDGKQARKTGSSSPLGLLFDHGCDAINTFISGLTLFTVIQLGNSFWSVWGFIVAFVTFFMATWEEYYIEALNLPCFNGANEGIMGVIIMLLVSAVFGTSFWNQMVFGLEIKYHVVFFFTVVAAVTIYGNYKTVQKKTGDKFNEALSNLNVLLYLVATLFIVYLFSPTNVISTSARYLIYFVGFSFGKLVGILQATHCAHEPFNQYRKSILISATVLNGLTLYGFLTGHPLINEGTVVTLLALFAFLAHQHFAINIISQFTEALGIRVFKIGKVTPPVAQNQELRKYDGNQSAEEDTEGPEANA
jgi:ethanolaminephosphotransferase